MLNIKVKVIDTETSTRSGIAKASGKPYSIKTQDNIFIELAGEVRRMPVSLGEGVSAYAPGNYILDIEKHLTLSRFDTLEFRPFAEYVLVPVSVSQPVSVDPNKTEQHKPDLKALMAGRS